ncbi:IclR family transcriptional regulator [Kocuria dechangensis]|uniref:IclR family transcriptional regulator n=1 Tax=Kocuria dechangensis TaxID=1176249 RepID=A0A917LXC8_9MICC|nr:IclR family transcriptional regulator [Kocuria dechangensis]GGG65208.1 IclR family transcriptional regulator [Kocuria dechangensis]
MANSRSGDSVISRVIRVLEAFDRDRPTMTLSRLAARAELPLSTTHRLVEELMGYGLIQRTDSGELRIGLRMWEISARSLAAMGVREAALPFMDDVLAVVHQHTTLAVLDENAALYVERMSAPDSVLDAARITDRMPLNACSSGLVLLAHSSPEFQDSFLSGRLTKVTDETPTDPGLIRRHLAEIRQRGFVALPGIGVSEWLGVAVPVFGAERTVVAALNAIVPRDQAEVRLIVPALLTAAHGISRTLAPRPRRLPVEPG